MNEKIEIFQAAVAVCIQTTRRLNVEGILSPSDASTLALDSLRHYGVRDGIPVQIESVNLETVPPIVFVLIPGQDDPDEYCAHAQDLFGDVVVLEPFR
jgi:hypothetical protein